MIITLFVVPQVTDFLSSQNIDLPISTRSLIYFSKAIQNNVLYMILSPIILFILYKILRKTWPKFLFYSDLVKLKIPIFGSIINKIDSSRFCNLFSITFNSGTGILECLETSQQIISNTVLKKSIIDIRNNVKDGQKLSQAITNSGHFPRLVSRVFKIGENSGNMESSLSFVNYFYDQEINDSIDKIVGMIQPTLTIIMGGMMTWIALAVFGPIYNSFSNF